MPSTSEELSEKELGALQKVFEQVATAAEKEKGKPSNKEMTVSGSTGSIDSLRNRAYDEHSPSAM